MPLPATSMNQHLYEMILQLGMSDLDLSAMIGAFEVISGI